MISACDFGGIYLVILELESVRVSSCLDWCSYHLRRKPSTDHLGPTTLASFRASILISCLVLLSLARVTMKRHPGFPGTHVGLDRSCHGNGGCKNVRRTILELFFLSLSMTPRSSKNSLYISCHTEEASCLPYMVFNSFAHFPGISRPRNRQVHINRSP